MSRISSEQDALFFNTPSYLRSELLKKLNCKFSQKDGVYTGRYEGTVVPGLFAAGNLLRDVQLAIIAAADGARAVFGINQQLTAEDLSFPQASGLSPAESTAREAKVSSG